MVGKEITDESIQPEVKLLINPPPRDGRCEVCGKPKSELKPFWGEPFEGAILVKNWRPDGLNPFRFKEGAEECFDSTGQYIEEKVIEKFGKENLEKFIWSERAQNTIGASWECSECLGLNDVGYFKKLHMAHKLRGGD